MGAEKMMRERGTRVRARAPSKPTKGLLNEIHLLTGQVQRLQGCVCFEGRKKLRHLSGANACRRNMGRVSSVSFEAFVERIVFHCRGLPKHIVLHLKSR
jgi:hypothetical protein